MNRHINQAFENYMKTSLININKWAENTYISWLSKKKWNVSTRMATCAVLHIFDQNICSRTNDVLQQLIIVEFMRKKNIEKLAYHKRGLSVIFTCAIHAHIINSIAWRIHLNFRFVQDLSMVCCSIICPKLVFDWLIFQAKQRFLDFFRNESTYREFIPSCFLFNYTIHIYVDCTYICIFNCAFDDEKKHKSTIYC